MASKSASWTFAVALVATLAAPLLAQQGTQPGGDQQQSRQPVQSRPDVAPAAVDATANTVIAVRDQLNVTTLNQSFFTVKGVIVDVDGTFEFSQLGRIKAAGLTPRQLEEDLKKRLSPDWVINPQVTVEVVSSLAKHVLVGGRVHAPGPYSFMGPYTVLNAILAAGSVADDAGERAFIIRGNPDGSMISAEQMSQAQKTYVDLHKLIALGDVSENYTLNNGDYVFVEQAQPILVTGEVKNVGPVAPRRGLTVQQAVALAGGLSDKGKNSGIKIQRPTNNAKKPFDTIEVKDWKTELVKPGDTIIVPSKIL